jgi:hypothetical protein
MPVYACGFLLHFWGLAVGILLVGIQHPHIYILSSLGNEVMLPPCKFNKRDQPKFPSVVMELHEFWFCSD